MVEVLNCLKYVDRNRQKYNRRIEREIIIRNFNKISFIG